MISNWQDSPFDLRRRVLSVAEAANDIAIPNEVAAALRELQLLDTDGERLVFGIRTHKNAAPWCCSRCSHIVPTGRA
jgi:hypothetical protein